ncbi:MAG TPA: hypothetical protein VMM55_14220, partial [Thermohalobaculum sp.]|nr:hypothetical protein [Thermohalobaculum sp.]
MSRPVRDAALLAGLVLLSAAFVDAIRGGGAAPPALTSAPAPAPEPVETPALPEIVPAPLEALTVALRRPVFFQSRRPPAAPTPAPAELDATLAGVLTTEVEKVAIVMPANADRATRLREGDL